MRAKACLVQYPRAVGNLSLISSVKGVGDCVRPPECMKGATVDEAGTSDPSGGRGCQYKCKGECDFVVWNAGTITAAIQVTIRTERGQQTEGNWWSGGGYG